MLFINPGHGTILFTPAVLNIFSDHRQVIPTEDENGGYLIGKQFGDQVVIEVATLPGRGDVQKRFFMQRNHKRGQKTLDHFWKLSGGELVLAGEWHTHPEANPIPSPLDQSETALSMKKGFYPLGFMVIAIIGNQSLVKSWFGVQTTSGLKRIERTGYRLWRDDK
jgi:integrative and conjugative element protein (TIGR02256 family)